MALHSFRFRSKQKCVSSREHQRPHRFKEKQQGHNHQRIPPLLEFRIRFAEVKKSDRRERAASFIGLQGGRHTHEEADFAWCTSTGHQERYITQNRALGFWDHFTYSHDFQHCKVPHPLHSFSCRLKCFTVIQGEARPNSIDFAAYAFERMSGVTVIVSLWNNFGVHKTIIEIMRAGNQKRVISTRRKAGHQLSVERFSRYQ